MNLSAGQIRKARDLLGWSTRRLAKAAKVSFDKALKAQEDEGVRALSDMDIGAVRRTFEAAGIEFKMRNWTVTLRDLPP